MKIGFIGAGNMGSALIEACLSTQNKKADILVSVSSEASRLRLAQTLPTVYTDNARLAKESDVIVLAVKPFLMGNIMPEIADYLKAHPKLVVSVATGLSLAYYTSFFGEACPVIRAMPNTPVRVGQGMTGLLANAATASSQRDLIETMFAAIGSTLWVKTDDDIDKITALSGSGPAYFFYLFHAMQEAAQALGFEENLAKSLVLKTVAGAVSLAEKSETSFLSLQQAVTAKRGTTEAALNVLNEHKVHAVFKSAIERAYQRAQAISQENQAERSH